MILIVTLAVASMVMVVAMVQFSAALVVADDAQAARRWGLAYAASWVVILAVLARGAVEARASAADTVALVTLVGGGWGGFHAFWLWLWLSLARSSGREGGAADVPPARAALARGCARAAMVALVVVGLALIELGAGRAVVAAVTVPGRGPLILTIAVAAAGAALLISGGVRLTLDRGTPMTHDEIDEAFRRQKFGPRGRTGPLRARASVYRHFGPAMGATADQEMSLSAMKAAWRSGAWRRERRLQTMFMMTAGGLMMLYGGFGAAIVAGPVVAKVICGGALAYATFQMIAAARRA